MNTQNIGPERFESIVRDTLQDVGHRSGTDAGLADRLIANAREGETKVVALRRRPTAWLAPLVAAAAVIAVAVGLVVATDHSGSTDRTGAGGSSPAPGSASRHSSSRRRRTATRRSAGACSRRTSA